MRNLIGKATPKEYAELNASLIAALLRFVSTIGAGFAPLQSIGRLNLAVPPNHIFLELAHQTFSVSKNRDFFTGLLVSVAADSAYDKEAVYEAIEAHSPGRRTRVVIPPQRNATLSQNSNTAMQERDRHIRAIERHGRREWYKLSGYTKRSMVENAVYRYKAIIGPEMRARTLARQRVEHRIGCEILNKMAALGMPDTYCAG